MSNTSNSSGGGMGFLSVLGLIFIVLKLVHVISWSWWLVLLPLYGGLLLFIVTVVAVILWTAWRG